MVCCSARQSFAPTAGGDPLRRHAVAGAMLRLRSSILAGLLSYSAASPIPFPLHRLLSSAAAVSPDPSFDVEDYLVATCGLTRAQALKASTKLSHLKSPTKPDAVLAFLAGRGLSAADVAAGVAQDPLLLCADVEKTLSPVFIGLTRQGLSHTEVARLVSFAPGSFRRRSIVSNLPYYLSLFGSHSNLLRVLKHNSYLLSSDLENKGKPNVAFLRECGLGACDIAKLCIHLPRLLTCKPDRLQAIVAHTEETVGVPRVSGMFRQALQAVAYLSQDKIAAKVEYLKNTFRWSDAEVRIAVCKFPKLLTLSEDMLRRKSEFLISEAELESSYVAHCPQLISYSLEGRLKPRYYVVKFLKENGLLDLDRTYYPAVTVTDKMFVERYISPHDEAAPYLHEDYATACRGELPPRFMFASTKGSL